MKIQNSLGKCFQNIKSTEDKVKGVSHQTVADALIFAIIYIVDYIGKTFYMDTTDKEVA